MVMITILVHVRQNLDEIIGQTSPPMEGAVAEYTTVAQEAEIRDEKKINFLVLPTKTKELFCPQLRDMLELDFNDKRSADI